MVELVFSTDHAKNNFWWLKNVMKKGNLKNQVQLDRSRRSEDRSGEAGLDGEAHGFDAQFT